ncbi:MAG: choice-of-anchor A family protein [Longicatena sp.]
MAFNFWLANDFNIFVMGNINQSDAYASGSVWVGKNATLKNYNVGEDLALEHIDYKQALQVLGVMNIVGGINYASNSGIDVLGSVSAYSMEHKNKVIEQPKTFSYRPYDTNTNQYLLDSSQGWAQLSLNGIVEQNATQLHLKSVSNTFCNFVIDCASIDVTSIQSIHLEVPQKATVLISIIGEHIILPSFKTMIHDVAISKEDASYVVWNFPSAVRLTLKGDIYGALLAPRASVDSEDMTIYGTLMTKNLKGLCKGINNPFKGELIDLVNPIIISDTTMKPKVLTASREQAINDLIQSIALEQTAISHIINAEGEKIQAVLKLESSQAEVLAINKSVQLMLLNLTRLEVVLEGKLTFINDCIEVD